MELPTLDLSRYCEQGNTEAAFYDQVLEQCSKYGFVKFIGHGIEDNLVAEAFEWAKKFFALPDEVKQAANRPPGPGPNRGYAAIGKERLARISGYSRGVRAPKLVEDVKESFDLGPEHDKRFPTPWPSEAEIQGFREFMQHFSDRCDEVHQQILSILQTALGLTDSRLLSLCDSRNGELRIAHYPSIDIERIKSGSTFRIAEHTDTGTLTLLFQDSVGGLEVEDQHRPGEFLPVTSSQQSEMIVNVGDTLQRWTGEKLRSANHRVVAPQTFQTFPSGIVPTRFSIGFFGKANPEALMRTLDEFVDPYRSTWVDDDFTTATEYYAGLQTKTFQEMMVST